MGLKADVEEVLKANWKNSPWWYRLWLCVSAYLAISSIASFAETVIKWKGFILDGVLFYRHWIRSPLIDIMKFLHLPIPTNKGDAIIAGSVLYGCYMRLMYSAASFTGLDVDKLCFWILTIIVTPLILLSFFLPAYIQWVIAIILFVFPIYDLYRNRLDRDETTRLLEVFWIPFYFQILFIILGVAFLAAINKGLQAS